MSYRRAKRDSEAAGVLERITSAIKVEENKSYLDLLLFYKGQKRESDILAPDKLADLDAATIGYGVANWHYYAGNKATGLEYFQRIVKGKAWAAFGFIAAETELVRNRS
jgi:hypothetical protein